MIAAVDLRLVRVHVEGYGRLRDFLFEPPPRPGVVVRAPNEAGKSTLASAIFRGLFGFEEKAREDARRPWEGGPFRVALEWSVGDDRRCAIARDFDTQEVSVEWRRAGGALERRWAGAPNPRGRSPDRDQYDAELRELLGFASPEIFHRTAFVGAGEAAERPLAEEVLRLLSGSERADFQAALAELAGGYYAITRADIEDPSRQAKRSPRRLEATALERDALEARARAAREAHDRRRRTADRRARARAAIEEVETELAGRRPVQEAIERLKQIARREAEARTRIEEIDGRVGGFEDWEARFREKEAELRPIVRHLRDPDDYAERMEALARGNEERDRRLAERERAREALARAQGPLASGLLVGGGALLAAAAGFLGTAGAAPGAVAAAGATAGAALVLWGLRRERGRRDAARRGRERVSELEAEIERLERERREVAGPLGLDPERVDPVAERRSHELARRLAAEIDGMKGTRDALGDRAALEAERRALKEEVLDVLRLERSRILDAHPFLGSDPDYERRFLAETARLVEERARLVEEEIAHRRSLADLPIPADDPCRLEAEMARLDEEAERLALERDAHRLAHRTLGACNIDFVSVMARRLEKRVGGLFADLTEGRYSEVHVDPATLALVVDGVEKIGVPAECLSRGARDQLYFALRAAILEILAAERALPILLDEPFLHFDADRLAAAGRALARLGETHQVLLLSHDPRLTRWSFPLVELPEPAVGRLTSGSRPAPVPAAYHSP